MKCAKSFLGGSLGLLLLADGAAAAHERAAVALARRPPFGLIPGGHRAAAPPAREEAPSSPADRPVACGRGGACSDSTPALFGKVALSAAVEAGLLYALVNCAVELNAKGHSPLVTKSLQAAALLAVIFGSATFGSILDSGMSAATRQLLDPNDIPGDEGWYDNLKKPSWNPPGWLFPIMWLIVSKPTQFAGVWKLVTQSPEKDLSVPLLAYCAHLSLGDAWNKVFFGLECTGRGAAVIAAFWGVLLTSAYLFYKVDQYAGLLLLPTCLWVTVAAALNLSIYLLNKDEGCE